MAGDGELSDARDAVGVPDATVEVNESSAPEIGANDGPAAVNGDSMGSSDVWVADSTLDVAAQPSADAPGSDAPITVAPRSLIETNVDVLRRGAMPLLVVLGKLAGADQDGPRVYHDLWSWLYGDNTNPSGRCDDVLVIGLPTLDGYPVRCDLPLGLLPSGEGAQRWKPLTVVNRFDLAPEFGEDCGEVHLNYYYERDPSDDPAEGPSHAYLRLSAVIPNPRLDLGLEGCRPLVQFWATLSEPRFDDYIARSREFEQALLHRVWTDSPAGGDPPPMANELKNWGFTPFMHPDKFGKKGRIQLSLSYDGPDGPASHFFEFGIEDGQVQRRRLSQSLLMQPIYGPGSRDVNVGLCQDGLLASVTHLVEPTRSRWAIDLDPACWSPTSSSDEARFSSWVTPSSEFAARIDQAIRESHAASSLRSEEIVERAQRVGTCVGCHSPPGQSQPTLPHVSDTETEPCQTGAGDPSQHCRVMSPWLAQDSLPRWQEVTSRFLTNADGHSTTRGPAPSKRTIGGLPVTRTSAN